MARKRVTIDSLSERCQMFGESPWSAGLGEVAFLQLHGTIKSIRERVRDACPATPGVYGMLSAEGHVIYVGMSNLLSKRLQAYFSSTDQNKKETRIRRRAVGVVWQTLPHELLAKIRERELIRKFRPDWNVLGQPVKMQVGYLVAVQQEARTLQFVSQIPKEHDGVWGPLPFDHQTQHSVEQLLLHFGLRDCPKQTAMNFRGETNLHLESPPSCLRADLQTCMSPCRGSCTRNQYEKSFQNAVNFLNGQSEKLFADLVTNMRFASLERQFEKAAKLRDRAKALQFLDNHLRRFHDWSQAANFIYRIPGPPDHPEFWLIVVRGLIVDLIPQPLTNAEKTFASRLIESALLQCSGRAPKRTVTQPGEFEAARTLYWWFEKSPVEKKRQLSLPQALAYCSKKLKQAS